jgi:ABC-type glycerol-3-phosphate transport system permease component
MAGDAAAGPWSLRNRRKMVRETLRYLVLGVASIVAIYPVWWVLSVALKNQSDYVQHPMSPPSSLYLHNFVEALTNHDLQRYALNTVVVVLVGVPLVTATSVAAGYALARLCGRGGAIILFAFIFSELVPLTVLAIPLLLLVSKLGIDNGIVRVVCAYSVALLGFGVLVSRAFFRSFPEELREAARLDGCGELQVFRQIMIPLARSPITFIAIVSFIFLWNEFFLAAVLINDNKHRTLPLGLAALRGEFITDWPMVAAALLLSTIPTLVIYALFQGRIANQFSRSTTRK